MRILRKKTLIPIVLVWVALTSAAYNPVPRNPEGLLDAAKPSVYLTFERQGSRSAKFKTESETGVWLRLHNNTTRPITIYGIGEGEIIEGALVDGALAYFAVDGAHFDLCYDVDAKPVLISRITKKKKEAMLELEVPYKAPVPEQSHFTSCYWSAHRRHYRTWLRPGHSVVFSVPENFLANNLRIATEISYEWESENGYIRGDEPRHLVYFTYLDLEATKRRQRKP